MVDEFGDPPSDEVGASMSPPQVPRLVICIHCQEVFMSDRIGWDIVDGMWSCPTPGCDGVGYGIDIHDAPQEVVHWQQ